ncbi:hypothetical protein BGZ61DRAFT_228295 [Ilyonectria robusta]|uniref:uncharacterized protein n=1 Tax=Ilyonectria robusta TaxID=1079257 RepID=UPI001E8D4185|nr:uncharacterized protein BGZ61DRAFT_228295 [Ilyonectria robusta]KAH8706833.1 hypothetical protein BGZ61DRAFT_228295 [Ilyonectria robusta]
MMTLDPCLECHSVPANDVPVDHEQFEAGPSHGGQYYPDGAVDEFVPWITDVTGWLMRQRCSTSTREVNTSFHPSALVSAIAMEGRQLPVPAVSHISLSRVRHFLGLALAGLTGGAGARTECRQGAWLIRLGSPVCPGRAINVGRLVVVGETMNPTKRHASGLTTAVDLIIKVASGSCAMQFATTPELLAAIHVEHTYSPCRGHTRPEMYAGG